MRLTDFFKKDLDNFLITIKDLWPFLTKERASFLNDFFGLKKKKTPILETLLFYKKNIRNIENSLPEMKMQELLMFLSLSSRMKLISSEFIQKLYENIKTDEILSLEKTNLNRLIWCYSNLNYLHENLQKSITNRIKKETLPNNIDNMGVFNAKNINRYLKSLSLYCSLNYEETSFCHKILLDSLMKHLEKSQVIEKKLLQYIWSFLITLSMRKSIHKDLVEGLIEKLPFHKPTIFQSNLQMNFKILLNEFCKENQIKFEEEKRILCYFVDFFIKPDRIIEINGPSHYVNCESFRTFGFDEVRRRNLKLLDYQVYDINYFKWKKLNDPYKIEYVIF